MDSTGVVDMVVSLVAKLATLGVEAAEAAKAGDAARHAAAVKALDMALAEAREALGKAWADHTTAFKAAMDRVDTRFPASGPAGG